MQWKVVSLEPKSPTSNVVGFTVIAVIPNLTFIHSQLMMFDDNYFRQCAHISSTKYIQIPCTYVFEVTLPMCLLFYHWIWQSCSEVVAILVIHVINQIMNGWRLTESVLYFMHYATLKYNYIEYQCFKYWCIFFIWQLFVFQYNKINKIRPIQEHYEVFFATFYDLQYIYMCNSCCLRTMYAN